MPNFTPNAAARLAAAFGLTLLASFMPVSPLHAAEPPADPAAASQKLAALRDKNRVLLVFTPTEGDARFQAQQKLWAKEKEGFTERDLVQLAVLNPAEPAAPAAASLARRLGVQPGEFSVVLIGKDGNDAYKTSQPVPADAIYARIDAMPMRRQEMRRQRGG